MLLRVRVSRVAWSLPGLAKSILVAADPPRPLTARRAGLIPLSTALGTPLTRTPPRCSDTTENATTLHCDNRCSNNETG